MSNEEIIKLQDELIKRLTYLNAMNSIGSFNVNACTSEIQLLKDYQLLYNLNKLTLQQPSYQYIGGAWSCDSKANKEYGSRCSESEIGSPTKIECEILCLAQHEKVATYENIIKFIVDRGLEFVIPINYLKDMLTGGTAKNAEFQRFKISRWYLGVREMIWNGPLNMGEIMINRLGNRIDYIYTDAKIEPQKRTIDIILDSNEDLAELNRALIEIKEDIEAGNINRNVNEGYQKLKEIRNNFIPPNKIKINDPQIIYAIKESSDAFRRLFPPTIKPYDENSKKKILKKTNYKHDINTPVDIIYITVKIGASDHANGVIIDYYRKRVFHIEPWIIESLGTITVESTFNYLLDLGYEYVSAETIGCPIGLQGKTGGKEYGGFCQTWAPFIAIMSVLNPTKLELDYLIGIQQNALDLLIMFMFYIYDVYGKATKPSDYATVISIKHIGYIPLHKCAIINRIRPLIDALEKDWKNLNPDVDDYISLLSLKAILEHGGGWCKERIIKNDIRIDDIINMFDLNRFPLLHARATSNIDITYDNADMQEVELLLNHSIDALCSIKQITEDLERICTIIRECKLAINIDLRSNPGLIQFASKFIKLVDLIDQYKETLISGKLTYQDFKENYSKELIKILGSDVIEIMPCLKDEIVMVETETAKPLTQPSTCIIL